MIVNRDRYLQRLIDRIDNGAIKVITGLRRAGKSVLLFDIFYKYLLSQNIDSEHIIRLALDSVENSNLLTSKALYSYLKDRVNEEEHYFILLDEIQLCSDFEAVLNSLNRNPNLDIYVTGSNSKFLSSDIITEFRGRGDQIRVYPLTFKEYFSVQEKEFSLALREYLFFGGMPRLLALKSEEQKKAYLHSLFNETYLKDIVERNNLNDSKLLEPVIDVLASSVGSLTNPSKIANTFLSTQNNKISDKTVKSYISLLEEAFLINKAIRYDIKGRSYISTNAKYYFSDLGLRNARLNFRQFESTHLMENLIYNELLYRGYSVDVGVVNIVEKDESGNAIRKKVEIDFICNQFDNRYYIQSAYSIEDKAKAIQEERPFLKVKDSFKKIIIVHDDVYLHRNENGTVIMSLRDFLLNEDSLNL